MLRLYLVQAFDFALFESNLITFEEYKSLKILHFAWVWWIEEEELKDFAFFSVDKVIISLRFSTLVDFAFTWFKRQRFMKKKKIQNGMVLITFGVGPGGTSIFLGEINVKQDKKTIAVFNPLGHMISFPRWLALTI